MVLPPINIPIIITQLMDILNGDVEDCKEILLVGKEFIMFLKEELEEHGEIGPRGVSRLIVMTHNGQRFDINVLMTALGKNVEVMYSGHTPYALARLF